VERARASGQICDRNWKHARRFRLSEPSFKPISSNAVPKTRPMPLSWGKYGPTKWNPSGTPEQNRPGRILRNCLKSLVGARGFEPPTPSPPDWCANQAALRSVHNVSAMSRNDRFWVKARSQSQAKPSRSLALGIGTTLSRQGAMLGTAVLSCQRQDGKTSGKRRSAAPRPPGKGQMPSRRRAVVTVTDFFFRGQAARARRLNDDIRATASRDR
jgi:hypothetical protein